MNTAIKLGAFILGLAAVFGVAFGAGGLTGPVGADSDPNAVHGGMGDGGHATTMTMGGGLPAGLLVSDRGHTLTRVPSADDEFAFRVIGPDGRAVTKFDTEHDKRMHLIVVRRDLSGFRHVHPRMDADGTWRIASPMSGPGTYRAFADFTPTGTYRLYLDFQHGGRVHTAEFTAVAAATTAAGQPSPSTDRHQH